MSRPIMTGIVQIETHTTSASVYLAGWRLIIVHSTVRKGGVWAIGVVR